MSTQQAFPSPHFSALLQVVSETKTMSPRLLGVSAASASAPVAGVKSEAPLTGMSLLRMDNAPMSHGPSQALGFEQSAAAQQQGGDQQLQQQPQQPQQPLVGGTVLTHMAPAGAGDNGMAPVHNPYAHAQYGAQYGQYYGHQQYAAMSGHGGHAGHGQYQAPPAMLGQIRRKAETDLDPRPPKRIKISKDGLGMSMKPKERTGGTTSEGRRLASSSAGGSSCHQCKSRRNFGDLTYCTTAQNKKVPVSLKSIPSLIP